MFSKPELVSYGFLSQNNLTKLTLLINYIHIVSQPKIFTDRKDLLLLTNYGDFLDFVYKDNKMETWNEENH